MHKMLQRQIMHHFGSPENFPAGLEGFLQSVSDAYEHFDEDREQLDRSLEISSKEFFENSNLLREAKENTEKIVLERTKQLNEEHAKLFAAINSFTLGLLIVNSENDVVIANNTVRKILDIPPTAIDERMLQFAEIAEKLSGVLDLRAYYAGFLSSKKEIDRKEFVFGAKYIRVILTPVILTEDLHSNIGTVMLIEDITEAKVAEQSRDEFFSIASHELRTPLTAIQGNASMLVDYYAEKIADADMRQMIDDILHSSKRLIQIVNDFLDVSRLEQNRMQFHNEEVDVTKLVAKTIEEVNDLAAAKHLTISLKEILVPIAPIHADSSRIKQILLNLLGNAIHYTNQGAITVGIQLIPGTIKISIEDTGVGIAEDQQAVLFRKFQQVGSKIHSRDVMSTGLGLYISKMIAEAMGGTVQLERSELGKGSVFSVTLPTREKDSSVISS